MYVRDTIVDKAYEGKSKVLEFGVYIIETLGSVGLPAEQIATAILALRPTPSSGRVEHEAQNEKGFKKRHKRNNVQITNSKSTTEIQSTYPGSSFVSVVHGGEFVQRVMRFVVEAKNSSPRQVISRILFYLADALGDRLDTPGKRSLEIAVGDFVTEAHVQRSSMIRYRDIPERLNDSITGVVLSYRERDDSYVPQTIQSKIHSGMHVNIPLRPFDATVQILPNSYTTISSMPQFSSIYEAICDVNNENVFPPEVDPQLMDDADRQDLMGRMMVIAEGREGEFLVPCTPQSFPPTPRSRTHIMSNYSQFTENVLWRARDELRGEQEENERVRMAIFNPKDCHRKLTLSCGGHCVSVNPKYRGNRAYRSVYGYRSVRTALSFQLDTYTYFEVVPERLTSGGNGGFNRSSNLLSLCIGVAPSGMPLRNMLPGWIDASCGLDSSGMMLCSGTRNQASGFTYGDSVGMCVRVSANTVEAAFFINGKMVEFDIADKDQSHRRRSIVLATNDTEFTSMYPVVSLKSSDTRATGHFTVHDMESIDNVSFWSEIRSYVSNEPIYALDGTRIW